MRTVEECYAEMIMIFGAPPMKDVTQLDMPTLHGWYDKIEKELGVSDWRRFIEMWNEADRQARRRENK